MFDRQIDVKNNVVFINQDDHVTVDCSFLKEHNIVFIAQKGSDIWVERDPYNGKETDFDFSLLEPLFAHAENEHVRIQKELKEIYDQSRDVVTPIQIAYAAHETARSDKLKEWLESPNRSVIEKTLWYSSTNLRRDNHLVRDVFNHLGISDENSFNRFFELAKSFR